MKVDITNNNYHKNLNGAVLSVDEPSDIKLNRRYNSGYGAANTTASAPSFRGKNLSKKLINILREVSDYMKEPSEMTNAIIAAVGTGAIAPIAIMCSPSKKTNTPEEHKIEREKKTFQALRQPVSAALAFGFQVPTTIGIAKAFNNLAYEKKHPMFNDEILGTLIPDTKYLKKQAKKALGENASEELKTKWADELAKVADKEAMKTELLAKLSNKYKKDIGMEITDAELNKMANEPKRLKNFIVEKMAKIRHESLVDAKVEELLKNNFNMNNITDFDLVTSEFQMQAKEQNKAVFEALRKDAKLSVFDKFIEAMGFSNKKLKKLAEAESEKAKEIGLEILKKENPSVLTNQKARLKNYVVNMDKKSQHLYGNKIFWLTLVTNLFMVAVSCIALNWLHPKFARFVDSIRDKKHHRQDEQNGAKVEVRA